MRHWDQFISLVSTADIEEVVPHPFNGDVKVRTSIGNSGLDHSITYREPALCVHEFQLTVAKVLQHQYPSKCKADSRFPLCDTHSSTLIHEFVIQKVTFWLHEAACIQQREPAWKVQIGAQRQGTDVGSMHGELLSW